MANQTLIPDLIDSNTRRHVASAGSFYTLQLATRLPDFNTGASQPASATADPPPIGSHSAQRKWKEIRASAGQSQSINTHDSALNERASHQFISSSTTSRAFGSAVPSASSALGRSSSRQQPPLAWAATLRTLDSRPYLRRQHTPQLTARNNATHRRPPTLPPLRPSAAVRLPADADPLQEHQYRHQPHQSRRYRTGSRRHLQPATARLP
jgi:hypothetical protein